MKKIIKILFLFWAVTISVSAQNNPSKTNPETIRTAELNKEIIQFLDTEFAAQLGTIKSYNPQPDKVFEITGGLFEKAIPLSVNRLLPSQNYHFVLIFGEVVLHKVAGFAGGGKYLDYFSGTVDENR